MNENRDQPLVIPLAHRLRPKSLAQVVGQASVRKAVGGLGLAKGPLNTRSMVLFGPPGSGKTTIAHIILDQSSMNTAMIDASRQGVGELNDILDKANGEPVLLFIDEFGAWRNNQQRALLKPMEAGNLIVIGALNEPPRKRVDQAVLSRCQVLQLQSLDAGSMEQILVRAEKEAGKRLPLSEHARQRFIEGMSGDARALLNAFEEIVVRAVDDAHLSEEEVLKAAADFGGARISFDNERRALVSALQKSIRNSDLQATAYWLVRLFDTGVEPRLITRRLIACAAEDIGLTDPNALVQAVTASQAVEVMGKDALLCVLQAALYLAACPKSNALEVTAARVRRHIEREGPQLPPGHILGLYTGNPAAADGYESDHMFADGVSSQRHLPEQLLREIFFEANERGFERQVLRRIRYFEAKRRQRSS